ncbi:MAG: hypothetical protein Q9208_005264 [Pyrenodesmia sp. 3 TL-2023]
MTIDTIANNTTVFSDEVDLSLVNDVTAIMSMAGGKGHLNRLSATQCLDAYKAQYISSVGDVLLVQSDLKTVVGKQAPFLSSPLDYPSNQWRCNWLSEGTCRQPEEAPFEKWYPYEEPVEYCLSENVPERCELNWNLQLGIIVVVFNLVNVICMLLTLWRHDISALLTLGDAIQSFLDRPDPHTQGCCIYSRHLIQLLMNWKEDAPLVVRDSRVQRDFVLDVNREEFLSNPKSKRWLPVARRWWSAASIIRWNLYTILFVAALGCWLHILQEKPTTRGSRFTAGLGEPTGNNILSINQSMLVTVLIANLPQTILSYGYVLFNSLYTCMLAGHEWTRFVEDRKTLRVTSPVGAQRSTFWLQLPYRYSLPLLVCSTVLAWLASQSLFLVKIDVLDHGPDGKRIVQPDRSILSCGYSPGAMILAFIVGTLIMLGAVLLGRRKYTSDMPIASTSSAAISAACHRDPDDPDASVLPLKWGVASKKNGIGHCCFSSKLVAPPIPGHMYA